MVFGSPLEISRPSLLGARFVECSVLYTTKLYPLASLYAEVSHRSRPHGGDNRLFLEALLWIARDGLSEAIPIKHPLYAAMGFASLNPYGLA
jgi:hypothetical protein